VILCKNMGCHPTPLQAKMVELATLLGTTRSDAEYQSFRQSQALRESLAKTEAELAGVMLNETECVGLAKTKLAYMYTLCIIYIGLARTVYIYTVYDRIFGDFPAKNTAYTPYVCSVVYIRRHSKMTP